MCRISLAGRGSFDTPLASPGFEPPTAARARYVCAVRTLAAPLALAAALAVAAAPAAVPAATLEKTTTSYATIAGEPGAPYSRLKLGPAGSASCATTSARAAQGPPRPPPLAAVLRPALGLPARRRGVARSRGDPRHRRLVVHGGLAAAGGTRAVRRRRGRPQVNRFDHSPIRHTKRRRARLALTITTGDSADNQQSNETQWVVALLEGGRVDPNSGVEGGACGALAGPRRRGRALHRRAGLRRRARVRPLLRPQPAVGRLRRLAALSGADGPRPAAVRGGRPEAPELRRVRQPRRHRPGQPARARPARRVARGCVKPLSLAGLSGLGALLTNPAARSSCRPTRGAASPTGRPTRRCTRPAARRDAHGFAFVDDAELRPRNGQAAYYAFTPKPGLRMIALNTVAEGDKIDSNGNLDSPQFRWLDARDRGRRAARRADLRLRPPPVRQPRQPRPRRGRRRLRAARGDRAGLRSGPPRLQASALWRRPGEAAARPSARRRLRRRPHAREPGHGVQASGRNRRLLGDRDRVGDRLADPVAPHRADGQPRRHAVDLRHADRPRRVAGDAGPGHAAPPASAPTRSPRWHASSPTTTRRPVSRPAPRGARRTATSSCCSTTRGSRGAAGSVRPRA